MAQEVGRNIKVTDKDDRIVIVISKDKKLKESDTGRSKLLASSGGFVTLEDISGDKFEGKDVGLSLILTVREKRGAKKNKKDDE
jgi:hypothetical protein